MLWLQQDLRGKAACQAPALAFPCPGTASALGCALGTQQAQGQKAKQAGAAGPGPVSGDECCSQAAPALHGEQSLPPRQQQLQEQSAGPGRAADSRARRSSVTPVALVGCNLN